MRWRVGRTWAGANDTHLLAVPLGMHADVCAAIGCVSGIGGDRCELPGAHGRRGGLEELGDWWREYGESRGVVKGAFYIPVVLPLVPGVERGEESKETGMRRWR